MTMEVRPTREDTFLALAEVFSLRGTCPRAKVGCVIVKGDHVIAHGYNGAPRGMPHCDDVGCQKPQEPQTIDRLMSVAGLQQVRAASVAQGCTNAVHAEENAIAYAARKGVSCEDAILYCTHEPCFQCARLIVQSGILAVVYRVPYRSHDGLALLEAAQVPYTWRFIDVDVTLGA